MADPLADVLNRINSDPLSAGVVAPPPEVNMPKSGIMEALKQFRPQRGPVLLAGDPASLDREREFLGHMSQVPTDVASGAVGLYPFVNKMVNFLKGEGPTTSWPGAEPLDKAAGAIHDVGSDVGDAVAGKELNQSLLHGTPTSVVSNWARLVGSVVPAPELLATKFHALQAGVSEVNRTAGAALKGLEMLTPITLNRNSFGANAVIAGGLGAGLEGLIDANTPVDKVKQLADTKAAGALDVSAQGGTEAKPGVVQAGFSTGDPVADTAIGLGILGVAIAGTWKRDTVARILKGTASPFTGVGVDEASIVPKWTQMRQQAVDDGASLDKMLETLWKQEGLPNHKIAADYFAESRASRRGASINTQMQQLYNEGKLPNSSYTVVPVSDMSARYSALSTAQKDTAKWAALAQHELETRRILTGQVNSGMWSAHPNPFPAFNMMSKTSADLTAMVRAGRADLDVDRIVNDLFMVTRRFPDYLVEQRATSRAEANKWINANPFYAPTPLPQGAKHYNLRNVEPMGGLEDPGNPFKELPKYLDEMVRFAEGEKIRRDFLGEFTRAKMNGQPLADQIIGRTGQQLGTNASDRVVKWRDAYGNPMQAEVNDPVVRRALINASSPSTLQATAGGLAKLSRFFEGSTVGALSAATGHIFAPASMLYNTTFGAVKREPGMAFGWLDKLTQQITGGKVGMPGDWMTLSGDAAFRAGQGMLGVLAQRGARAIRDSIVTDGVFSRSIGPASATKIGDALENHFKNTWVYTLQKNGVLGPSSMMSVDPAKAYSKIASDLEKRGLMSQAGGLIGDIMHAISAAPAASIMAMNKGAPQWKINATIRDISGDPAKAGLYHGKVAEFGAGGVNATPWGNIFLQSLDSGIRAMGRHPGSVLMGMANGVAIPAVLMTIHNASLGPEYTDYQTNKRTPDRQASAMYLGIPGMPPEQGIELDIDPWLRPFKHVAETTALANLGLLDGTLFKKENAHYYQSLKDMVWGSQMGQHRQFSFDEGSTPRSILQQTFIPPLPPPVPAGAAAMGVKLRSYDEARPLNTKHTTGFSDADNGNPYATFMGRHVSPQMEEIVRSLGGTAVHNVLRTAMDWEQNVAANKAGEKDAYGNDISPAKRAGQAYVGRVKDSFKFATPLMGSFLAVTPSEEAGSTLIKQKMDGLKRLNDAFKSSTIPGGVSSDLIGNKRAGFQQPMGAGPVQATDPQMLQIGEEAGKLVQALQQQFSQKNQMLYQQRQSIQNSAKYSPDAKRAMLNMLSGQITDNNRNMLTDMERMEGVLSNQFGRVIRFEKLLAGKSMKDQPQ